MSAASPGPVKERRDPSAPKEASPSRLSKSKYLWGLQCHKRFYLQILHPELLPGDPAPALQAILDTGHEVGRVATTRYPGGVLIDRDALGHDGAVAATKDAFANPKVPAIFEAALRYRDIQVHVDVLLRRPGNRWHLIEVKSSTRRKPIHLPDVAIQLYVAEGAGLNVSKAGILHLNSEYVRRNEIDLEALFTFEDLIKEARAERARVISKLRGFRAILEAGKVPDIEPGPHCWNPFDCPFTDHCIEPLEAYAIGQLPQSGKLVQKLAARGIEDLREVPEEFPMSEAQRRALVSVVSGREHIGEGLRAALEDVSHPC